LDAHALAEQTGHSYNGVVFSVTQELPFCYGHRLLNHPGRCGRLHGHNGVARITLRAEALDRHGMVADFDAIERSVRAFLDETLDHRMLLHRDDPVCGALRAAGEPFVSLDFSPTAENIARMIFEHAKRAGFPVVEVQLVEMQGSIAAYSPG
jgi:6-pyruvoyltetrahydropterin/6-carboxytetrahydropterin synthase